MTSIVETAVRVVGSKAIAGISAFNRWRLPERVGPHPLLTGIHQPMTEELTLADLPVSGTIPPELDGRYLRIGPNPIDADPRSYHWFTGDGMVHGIRIADGATRWYRNRWIRSAQVGKATGRAAAPGPRHGGFDTVNTSVVAHAGAAYALVEAGSTPVRLDETMDAQRYSDFEGTLAGSFTAHPHRDPLTGDLHAICYEAIDPGRIRHVVVDADGRVRREVTIPVADGPMIHDCALTRRFVLILDLPITLSLRTVLGGREFPYRWNPAHAARLGLLPRDGGADDIVWIGLDPCFVFHTANAYDLPDGRIVLDAIVYDRMFGPDRGAGDHGPDEGPRGFERWTIDPVARTVERRTLDATPQELPRIDERRVGQPYRYAYVLGLPDRITPELVGEAPLYKHDLETGARAVHAFGAGRVAGEFMFVPRTPDATEDDGWLMGLVVEPGDAGTTLEIIDARAFAGPAIASVRLPHRVPPGFHGTWVPA